MTFIGTTRPDNTPVSTKHTSPHAGVSCQDVVLAQVNNPQLIGFGDARVESWLDATNEASKYRKFPSCPALNFTVTVIDMSLTELKAQ